MRTNTIPEQTTSSVYIHPTAICDSQEVGEGTRVWAFAHVLNGAVIGRNCNIGDHVYIEGGAYLGRDVTVKNQVMIWEGVTIEDGVFVGPGVIFTNDRHPRSRCLSEAAVRYSRTENWLTTTTVKRGAAVGARTVILSGLTIGCFASIGAGAVVTKDVPDHRIMLGNPARPIGWACACGMSLNVDLICESCKRRFSIDGHDLVNRG